MTLAGAAPRIGPNALTRVAEALHERGGSELAERVFHAAALDDLLVRPPTSMVDEQAVVQLHRALRGCGVAFARGVAGEAGLRTAEYLLAHRIPRGVQRLLRALPARAASALLLRAIGRHAWTFAGSAHFAHCAVDGRGVVLTVAHCPLCRGERAGEPLCDFYAATFERLYRVLVSPGASVHEIACEAGGAPACTFAVRW